MNIRKIIKIIATRWNILWLKGTEFYSGWSSTPNLSRGAYNCINYPVSQSGPLCSSRRVPEVKTRQRASRTQVQAPLCPYLNTLTINYTFVTCFRFWLAQLCNHTTYPYLARIYLKRALKVIVFSALSGKLIQTFITRGQKYFWMLVIMKCIIVNFTFITSSGSLFIQWNIFCYIRIVNFNQV